MAHDQWCEAQLVPQPGNTAGLCLCRLRELSADVAALRQDAARYRWLRDGERTMREWDIMRPLWESMLDAAIDAALAAQKD